jgi:hypothetical protein
VETNIFYESILLDYDVLIQEAKDLEAVFDKLIGKLDATIDNKD